MWTNGFERPVSNVFEVQDELTKAIVAALTPKLSGDTAAAVAAESRGTIDPLAYDLYLRGRFEWNKRTTESIKEGVADFERAVARDPRFARAHAALASSYAILPDYAGRDEYPLDKSLAAVRSNASKALAIDSTLAEPHAALGEALEDTWYWAESEREFKKAIALDPSYPTGHQWYAGLLSDMGRLDDALAEMRIARKLDPLSVIIAEDLCVWETRLGHFDLAATPCKESLVMHDGPAFNYMVRGKYDSAAVEWRRTRNIFSSLGMVAYSLARGGHRSEADALLKELEKKAGNDP